MESFNDYVNEYRKQMEKGVITKAYKGLMEYIQDLRMYFKNNYPDYFVSGSIYFGYMDMTYFSFFPKSIKLRQLKVAIVFIHETCRFEIWLAGANKEVQSRYWQLLKENGWKKYPLVPTTRGVDAIIEYVIVEKPDFNELDSLTKQIELKTLKFIEDVENFLKTTNS